MNIHQQHFEINSVIWSHYEHDGNNPLRLDSLMDPVVSPVGVVGGGWGLISKHLMDKGHDVTTIDKCESMAFYANKNRGIKTIVGDFLDYRFDKPVSTLIINTGVLTPSVAHSFRKFAHQISINLANNGAVVICIHEQCPFDEVVEFIGLSTSSALLVSLCEQIERGDSLVAALRTSEAAMRFSDYTAYRFASEFNEYESQIRNTLEAFRQGKLAVNSMAKLAENLRYVQFGLSHEKQSVLMRVLDGVGLSVKDIYKEYSTVLIKLERS